MVLPGEGISFQSAPRNHGRVERGMRDGGAGYRAVFTLQSWPLRDCYSPDYQAFSGENYNPRVCEADCFYPSLAHPTSLGACTPVMRFQAVGC